MRFGKKLVVGIFVFLLLFTIANLYIFYRIGNEPVALIGAVFAICGFEYGMLGVLKRDERKRKSGDDMGGNDETEINQ